MTLLLFSGGILVSAALVASQFGEVPSPSPAASTVALGADPAFMQWAGEDTPLEDGKGKLLGHVERNGELIEVREAIAEDAVTPERPDVDEGPDPEPEPDQVETGLR